MPREHASLHIHHEPDERRGRGAGDWTFRLIGAEGPAVNVLTTDGNGYAAPAWAIASALDKLSLDGWETLRWFSSPPQAYPEWHRIYLSRERRT